MPKRKRKDENEADYIIVHKGFLGGSIFGSKYTEEPNPDTRSESRVSVTPPPSTRPERISQPQTPKIGIISRIFGGKRLNPESMPSRELGAFNVTNQASSQGSELDRIDHLDSSPCRSCPHLQALGKADSDDNCIIRCEDHAKNILKTTPQSVLDLTALKYYICKKNNGETSKVDVYYQCCGRNYKKGEIVGKRVEEVRLNHHALAAELYSYHNSDGTIGGFKYVDLYDGDSVNKGISVQDAREILRRRYASRHGEDIQFSEEEFALKSFWYKLGALLK